MSRRNADFRHIANASTLPFTWFPLGMTNTSQRFVRTFSPQASPMSAFLLNRITINPETAHGKPTVRNKRYTVEGLLEYLAGGDTIEELLQGVS